MPQRWECRYSPAEMLYLELRGQEVITYLDHAPDKPDRYAFDDVLAGGQDAMIAQLFGAAAVGEVKAEILKQRNTSTLSKEQLRQQRRKQQR